jgi:hypothetical protein
MEKKSLHCYQILGDSWGSNKLCVKNSGIGFAAS